MTSPMRFLSDPDRIQTYNLLIRSQILYSVELRGHSLFGMQKYKKNKFMSINMFFFQKRIQNQKKIIFLHPLNI